MKIINELEKKTHCTRRYTGKVSLNYKNYSIRYRNTWNYHWIWKNIPSDVQEYGKTYSQHGNIRMAYFQNHDSIQEPVYDCILLYFPVFITHVNKDIQASRIHVALIREDSGSYAKHTQSCIYPYLVRIQEKTVPKMPVFTIALRSAINSIKNLPGKMK